MSNAQGKWIAPSAALGTAASIPSQSALQNQHGTRNGGVPTAAAAGIGALDENEEPEKESTKTANSKSSQKKSLTTLMQKQLVTAVQAAGAHKVLKGSRDQGIGALWKLFAIDVNSLASFQEQGEWTPTRCKTAWE